MHQHLGRRWLCYLLVQLLLAAAACVWKECLPSSPVPRHTTGKAGTGHPMSDLPALSLLPEQHLCSVGGQDPHAISEGGTGDRATIGTC